MMTLRAKSTALAVLFMLLVTACGDGQGATSGGPEVGTPVADGAVTTTVVPETAAPVDTTTTTGGPDSTDGPTEGEPVAPNEQEGTVDDSTDTTPPGDLELNPVKPQPAPAPGTSIKLGIVDPAMMPMAERAREDLAERLGVAPGTITIATAEAVVWPDGSRGCPQPGMSYIQVMTEGVRILLVHDDATYSYHGGGVGDIFLCDNPTSPAGGSGGFGDS